MYFLPLTAGLLNDIPEGAEVQTPALLRWYALAMLIVTHPLSIAPSLIAVAITALFLLPRGRAASDTVNTLISIAFSIHWLVVAKFYFCSAGKQKTIYERTSFILFGMAAILIALTSAVYGFVWLSWPQ